MMGADKLAPATRAAYDVLRRAVPPIERDVVMYEQMEKCERIVREGTLIPAVEAVAAPVEAAVEAAADAVAPAADAVAAPVEAAVEAPAAPAVVE